MSLDSAFEPIHLSAGSLSVAVLPQGATLHRILVRKAASGQERDIIAGPENPQGHVAEGRKFYAQLVGRYANRLPGGRATVPTAEGDIQMDLECNHELRYYIHGGTDGFDLRRFEPIPSTHRLVSALFPAVELPQVSADDSQQLFLHLHSPHGDQGFPGALDIVVRVQVRQPSLASEGPYGQQAGIVSYDINARLADGQADIEAGTPVNMTLHAGYLLKRQGEPDGIREHKLSVKSRRMVELGDAGVPTGNILTTEGMALDLSRGDVETGQSLATLGASMSNDGIDNCFIFDEVSGLPQAALRSPSCDCTLLFRTNQASIQCYTANANDGTGTRKALHGDVHSGYPSQGVVFLEFQAPPATFVHRALIDAARTDTILKPGQIYRNHLDIEIWQRI